MLTVKFVKYGRDIVKMDSPTYTKAELIREAHEVHKTLEGHFPCTALTLINSVFMPMDYMVGPGDATDWNVAYVMNEAGKTVDTIR